MCGIVGLAQRRTIMNAPQLEACRDTMSHRGPDDAGLYISDDRHVAFAHRRLSVIDLSPGGHQPMLDNVSDAAITFNGEIYNYREVRDELREQGHAFSTSSDTEVILAAYRQWDTACVERLRGQFALAIHDRERRRLFLARDRVGEKPLFYRHAGGGLAFASELKALMRDPSFPRELDLESLDHYLAFAYVPRDRCILRGVRKLLPGHALLYDIDRDTLRTWPYWSLPKVPEGRAAPDDELLAEFERLLESAVREQMLAADVPVGILLSGGIDSSLITAMAARASSRPVRTFTISFPGHGRFDEGPFARQVASHFGTRHEELVADEATFDLLPALARQYDEPMGDSSMIPTYLVSRLIRREATVALGGDGGDELFGGYPHYSWLAREEALRRWVPSPLRRMTAAAARRWMPLGTRGRNRLLGFSDAKRSLGQINIFFDVATRRRLLVPLPEPDWTSPEQLKMALAPERGNVARRAMVVDFLTYLPDDILTKVDRASMLCSLELRAPFLDPRLVEFAFGRLPDRLRATARERKILPRLLAQRLLPSGMDLRRKHGFSIPLHAWFTGASGAFMRDVLAGADPRLFRREVINEIVRGQVSGRANENRLFILTLFELWRREYRIAF